MIPRGTNGVTTKGMSMARIANTTTGEVVALPIHVAGQAAFDPERSLGAAKRGDTGMQGREGRKGRKEVVFTLCDLCAFATFASSFFRGKLAAIDRSGPKPDD
jgi:hypothetical protein